MVKNTKNNLRVKFSQETVDKTTDTSKYFIGKHVMWEEINDEVFRFNKDTGLLDSINESGRIIWAFIASHKYVKLSDICANMQTQYPHASKSTIASDTKEFLRKSQNDGYLSSVNKGI